MCRRFTHPSGAWAELTRDETGWTLQFIAVPEALRGQRIATTLLFDIIIWMNQTGVRAVEFIPLNLDFWRALEARFPNQIKIRNFGTGQLRT